MQVLPSSTGQVLFHRGAPRRRERRVRDVEVLHLSPLPAARAKHNSTILSLAYYSLKSRSGDIVHLNLKITLGN